MHKRYRLLNGALGQWVADTKTECPPELSETQVREKLPSAIEDSILSGRCSELRDGDWPRYVWGRTRMVADRSREGALRGVGQTVDVVWEARVTNRDVPEYKAYPITESWHSQAMPAAVVEALWPEG
jgi:hypothetical protein